MKDFIDLNAIGTYIIPVLTTLAGWFAGRGKSKNDFLKDLQSSIDLLTDKNTELLKKVIALGDENTQLLQNQTKLQLRIDVLTEQNNELRKEVEALNAKLADVKTITKQ